MTPSAKRHAFLLHLRAALADAVDHAEQMVATGVEPDDKRTAQLLRALHAEARANLDTWTERERRVGGAA